VLILGLFTDERKAILDALRDELRKRDYLPILFDFAVPATRNITETVSLLARMARFIIADLTDPSSIPKELEAIVPQLAVSVQPLLEGASRPYAMFRDYWKYEWVLPVYRYEGLEALLATLADRVIDPAEGKVKAQSDGAPSALWPPAVVRTRQADCRALAQRGCRRLFRSAVTRRSTTLAAKERKRRESLAALW